MSGSSPNNADRLEQIVAYLDGELTPDEVRLVERRIAEDSQFRHELQSIDRAWSALDALPTATAGNSFSQTTMELVIQEVQQELTQKTSVWPAQRRRANLTKVLALAAAAALGFLVVRLVRENPNRTLIADLPVIRYIDTYSQLQNVDLLRRLNTEIGSEPWSSEISEADLVADIQEFDRVADAESRRDWLSQLNEQDRADLRNHYNRFVALPPEEQERLRNLHASLASDSDSRELRRTFIQYLSWLDALPASEQFELRKKPVDERVRQIVEQQRREANNPWIRLSPEEIRRMGRALATIREQLLDEIPPPRGPFPGPHNRGERNPNFAQQVRQQVGLHRDEWVPLILDTLNSETRRQFDGLEPLQQQRQVVRWIMQNRNSPGGRGEMQWNEVSQQELERFFTEETDAATKERLLAQPRDKMEQQLKRMYFRREFQGELTPERRPPPMPGGFGPRRDFGRRPDGPPFEGPPPRRGPPPGPPDGTFRAYPKSPSPVLRGGARGGVLG